MKPFLSEKNLVVVLFVLVLIIFAMAQEDSKKMEKAYIGLSASASSVLVSIQAPELRNSGTDSKAIQTPTHSE